MIYITNCLQRTRSCQYLCEICEEEKAHICCDDGTWRCYNYAIEVSFNPGTGFIIEEDELDREYKLIKNVKSVGKNQLQSNVMMAFGGVLTVP
jgi:hypothetical protein